MRCTQPIRTVPAAPGGGGDHLSSILGNASREPPVGPRVDLEVVLPDESPDMPAATLGVLARTAERLGYHTAWLPDHILPPEAYGPVFGGVYEPLVTIGFLAAVTERLRFGTSVLVAPLRNPFVLAKQVATLARLSGDRVTLGLGVGWNRPEFAAVGADYRRRGEITDHTLELLAHLFSGSAEPYRGPEFGYERGIFEPVPAAVPIMIGGNSPAALRRAARWADSWQAVSLTPAEFAERMRLLAATPARPIVPTIRIGWPEGASATEVAETARSYDAVGARRVAVHFGPHESYDERMTALARILVDRR